MIWLEKEEEEDEQIAGKENGRTRVLKTRVPRGFFSMSDATTCNQGFQTRTGSGDQTVKTGNWDENQFFKNKEPDFLLIP